MYYNIKHFQPTTIINIITIFISFKNIVSLMILKYMGINKMHVLYYIHIPKHIKAGKTFNIVSFYSIYSRMQACKLLYIKKINIFIMFNKAIFWHPRAFYPRFFSNNNIMPCCFIQLYDIYYLVVNETCFINR